MVSLYVQREKLSKSFENQVLVTQSLHAAKRILLIIHDPPEIMAIPDPISAKVESHNAWLNDGVMPYIDWAIANNFGVIDVNIPMHIESEDEKSGYLVRPTEAEHQEQMKELMCYLWDNYLEGYESDDIVLMGVGDSYLGVKQLLTSRGKDLLHRL
jgi:histone deacetylase 6